MRRGPSIHRGIRQGFTALAGRVSLVLLWAVVTAVLVALRVLLVLVVVVLRPFITWPLMAACLGGIGATVAFVVRRMWHDALRAGFVTLICALVFALYAAAAEFVAPGVFDQVHIRRSPWWDNGGRDP